MIDEICKHTNAYAEKDGSWYEVKPAEFKKLLALIIYFGLVKVNNMLTYWSTKTLYHGLWARNIIPNRDRFKALMAVLHVVDFSTEDENDRLRKVRQFTEQMRNRYMDLYQAMQNGAIDERMVKSKHRSGMRQYMPGKPEKFGLKLWVLADVITVVPVISKYTLVKVKDYRKMG